MPSAQATPTSELSCCSGWASAFAHPHEQRRPFESSGQIPRPQAQWDPRGGSEKGTPTARATTSETTVRVMAVTAAQSFGVGNTALHDYCKGFH